MIIYSKTVPEVMLSDQISSFEIKRDDSEISFYVGCRLGKHELLIKCNSYTWFTSLLKIFGENEFKTVSDILKSNGFSEIVETYENMILEKTLGGTYERFS